MEGILKKYFERLFNENRMSHAFLICNTSYDAIKEELLKILSEYFFNGKFDTEENPDLIVIRPDNGKIVKENILSLQEQFMTKSQINDNKVYIIACAEKMNEYASNSLLKFLEEPENGIYAFLISENVNKILPTIKSRCQIVNISSESSINLLDIDEEVKSKSLAFIQLLEDKKINSIGYIYDVLNKKEDKETISNLLQILKCFYRDILLYKLQGRIEIFGENKDLIVKISDNNNEKTIINKLIIINKYENMLEYNLNISLFLDRLIIGMVGVANE